MIAVRSLARTGWTGWRLTGAVGLLLLGGLVTSQMWVDLARLALTGPGMVYLPLVPMVIGWVVWVRRRRGRLCQPGGHPAAPAVVLAGWLLYQLGARAALAPGAAAGAWAEGPAAAGSSALASLALHGGGWLVMVGCVLAVCQQAIWQFRPAVGALAFAVPAPLLVHETWFGPLHQTLIDLSWSLCHMLGITGGGVTALSAHQVSTVVTEVGGGLALLLGLCAVSYAFAFSRPWRWSVRAVILVLSPVAAVLCGLVSLVVTAWLLGRFAPPAEVLVPISRGGMLVIALAALAALLRLLAWASMPLRLYPRASLEQ